VLFRLIVCFHIYIFMWWFQGRNQIFVPSSSPRLKLRVLYWVPCSLFSLSSRGRRVHDVAIGRRAINAIRGTTALRQPHESDLYHDRGTPTGWYSCQACRRGGKRENHCLASTWPEFLSSTTESVQFLCAASCNWHPWENQSTKAMSEHEWAEAPMMMTMTRSEQQIWTDIQERTNPQKEMSELYC
jgi:hypothetical protein